MPHLRPTRIYEYNHKRYASRDQLLAVDREGKQSMPEIEKSNNERAVDQLYCLNAQVMKGQFLTPERGWKCVLAFFAFDDNIPGSNR